MPRIPTGNFGFSTPGRAPSVEYASAAPIGEALRQIGEKKQQDALLLARAKASNGLDSYRQTLGLKAQDIQDRITRGELPYAQAHQTYEQELQDIEVPAGEGVDPVTAENLGAGIKATQTAGFSAINSIVDRAQRADFQNQFSIKLDLLGKDAGAPGADINTINAKADAFAPLARAAGVPEAEVSRSLQNFKDKNWENNARQRAMESRQDLKGLESLEHDLTAADGYYSGKLDTDRRNAVLNFVISSRISLENALEREAAKHDTRGERALNQIDRQIATGVPATADMWSDWAADVRGTPAEAEFSDRLADEREVQQVLRKPVDEQLKYIEQKRATLTTGGGSAREASNLSRLQSAVQSNVQQMQQAPLEFSAQRTGIDVKPLDVEQLLAPGGADQVADQMNERVITLKAMRKQYGEAVPMRPLLAPEVQVLSSMLDKATPDQAAQLFSTLSDTFDSPDVYTAAMQQIAPDAPVKALAGLIAGKPVNITTERHLFSADEQVPAHVVAATMLEGERLLNPSKAAKSEDGKTSPKLFLPESRSLQSSFTDQVGNAFAGRPKAAETAFQAVQAYYVGKASQTGRLATNATDIDSKIVKEAINATLGVPVDYNGQGTVLAPWGMDRSTFEDRIEQSFTTEIKKHDLPDSLHSLLPSLGLRNNGDGTYYLTQGRNYLTDKNGRPVLVNVNP